MRKLILLLVMSACVVCLGSCGRSDTGGGGAAETAAKSREKAGPAELEPQFAGRVFCENVKYGGSSSCRADLGDKGKLTCGHQGAVSEITWKLIGRREGQDVYQFQRRFPVGGSSPKTQRKEVAFKGESVVVFQDETQKISIIPQASEQSSAADRSNGNNEG